MTSMFTRILSTATSKVHSNVWFYCFKMSFRDPSHHRLKDPCLSSLMLFLSFLSPPLLKWCDFLFPNCFMVQWHDIWKVCNRTLCILHTSHSLITSWLAYWNLETLKTFTASWGGWWMPFFHISMRRSLLEEYLIKDYFYLFIWFSGRGC